MALFKPPMNVTTAITNADLISSNVTLLNKSGATYTKLQEWTNNIQSSGRISGGIITPHSPADGTVDISALTGFIKYTDSEIAETRFFDLAASTSVALTDNQTNYIYVEYNVGNPRIQVTTDRSTIRQTDQFTLGRAFRSGNDVEVLVSGINLYNRTRKLHEKWIDTFGGVSYASGLLVTFTGLKPAFSAGVMYAGSNKVSIASLDCNASGTFESYYTTDNGSTWTIQTSQTSISATQYNNPASGLATLSNNQYGVHWLYICPNGELYLLYGKASYTLAQAQAAASPVSPIPNYLAQWAKLAAKVIILKGASTPYSITPAWSTAFPVQSPGAHNDLAGLQGGTTDQYYHLTSTQSASVVIGPASVTDGTIALYDGTTGKVLKGSTYTPSEFATTGHTHSGYVATSDYEDSDVLNKVKNVDGYRSGLDADLWCGYSQANFIARDASKLDNDYPYSYRNIMSASMITNTEPASPYAGLTVMVGPDPTGAYWSYMTPGQLLRWSANESRWYPIGNMYDVVI